MSKEKLSILKKVENKLFESAGPAGLAVSVAVMGLLLYGVDTIFDSQNNLSEIKKNNLSTPPISAQCDLTNRLDMGCMTQVTREVCDGNNTFNRSDDVCETIDYWYYVPEVNLMR